ncbi:hypothetical protein [Streptomyces sp. Qhu_M48]|uniref:hypothetical protein n=1 Tax=Streptomyces sp. Qhu_M48 TaxID=3435889 RepID=UPI003F4F7037
MDEVLGGREFAEWTHLRGTCFGGSVTVVPSAPLRATCPSPGLNGEPSADKRHPLPSAVAVAVASAGPSASASGDDGGGNGDDVNAMPLSAVTDALAGLPYRPGLPVRPFPPVTGVVGLVVPELADRLP